MSASVGAATAPPTPSSLLYHSLSALTDDVVDHLYNIDRAIPQTAPTFLFLVGAPGSGKSSGHARAIEAGLLPATPPAAYATLNVDTLLEALEPFRAASSMAHLLKKGATTRELTKFASISAYGTRKENLGLFKWYNTAHDELAAADPDTIAAFNTVRAQFAEEREADAKLLDLHDAALTRALAKGVSIVYETTLSLNKSGRVAKVDDIMDRLPAKYTPVMWHIKSNPEDLPRRVRARQEQQMPADPFPYYRYIPAKLLGEMAVSTATAFEHIRTSSKYATIRNRLKVFDEYENPFNAARLAATPSPPPFAVQRNRIVAAYGPTRSASTSLLAMKYGPIAPRAKTQKLKKTSSPPRTGGASAAAAPPNRNVANLTELLSGLTVAAPPVSAKIATDMRNLTEMLNSMTLGPPPGVVATMENLISRIEATNAAARKKSLSPVAAAAALPSRTRTTQKAPRKATPVVPSSIALVASLLKKK